MAVEQVISDEETGRGAPAAKSGVLKVLLVIFAALLLIGTTIGATLFLTGVLGEGTPARDAQAVPSGSEGQRTQPPPIYVELGEPFVVNFIEGNQIRYLQVRIEVMTRDSTIAPAVNRHLPRIRNNLVFMFSGFDYAALGTVAGKEKIRDQALAEVQNVLRQETGSPGVEAVYFTSFVMQ